MKIINFRSGIWNFSEFFKILFYFDKFIFGI